MFLPYNSKISKIHIQLDIQYPQFSSISVTSSNIYEIHQNLENVYLTYFIDAKCIQLEKNYTRFFKISKYFLKL